MNEEKRPQAGLSQVGSLFKESLPEGTEFVPEDGLSDLLISPSKCVPASRRLATALEMFEPDFHLVRNQPVMQDR